MALVLDELVLTLGIDTGNLSDGEKAALSLLGSIRDSMDGVAQAVNKGEKEAGKALKKTRNDFTKTGKTIETSGKKVVGFFSGLRKEILALAGVTLTLASIDRFITRTSDNLNSLGINSKAFGMTAKELDGYRRTFEQGGATKEDADGILSKISLSKSRLASGNGYDDFAKTLMEYSGRNGANIDFQNMTTQEIMSRLSTSLSGLDSESQLYWGNSRFGLSQPALQVMSDKDFNAQVAENTRKSQVTEETIKENRKFRQSMQELSNTFESIGQKIMQVLLPYLNAFAKWLDGLADWFREHPEKIEVAFEILASAIKTVADWANTAADSVGGWENAIKILIGAAVGGALISWFGTLAAVAGSLAAVSFNPAFLTALAGAGGYALGSELAKTETGKEVVSAIGGTAYWLTDTGTWWTSDGQFFMSKSKAEQHQAEINAKQEIGQKKVIDLLNGKNTDPLWDFSESEPSEQKILTVEDILSQLPKIPLGDVGSIELQKYADTPKEDRERVGLENLKKMSGLFRQIEQQYSLPPGLLYNMAKTESGGFSDRESVAGARGLMQFMPGTQKDMGLIGDDVFDPVKSAWAAGKYMRQLLNKHKALPESLAAYNWGTGNVDKKGMGSLPEETRNYLDKILTGMKGDNAYLLAMAQNIGAFANQPPVVNNNNSRTTNINGPVNIQSEAKNVQELSRDINTNYPNQTALRYASGVSG